MSKKVFVTKVWGFDPIHWPIIPFNIEGNRSNFGRNSKPGDLVAFIGTQGEETADEDKGRFLGMATARYQFVNSREFIDRGTYEDPKNQNKQGQFKWPFALRIERAWVFPEKPLASEIIEQRLFYYSAVGAVQLTDDKDINAVLAISKKEVQMNETQENIEEFEYPDTQAEQKPTTGPVPHSGSRNASDISESEAYTYAFQFGDKELWKIGWATDIDARLKDINTHVPSEILNRQKWNRTELFKKWESKVIAHKMEQIVLNLLHDKRTSGERVKCSKADLYKAWQEAMYKMD